MQPFYLDEFSLSTGHRLSSRDDRKRCSRAYGVLPLSLRPSIIPNLDHHTVLTVLVVEDEAILSVSTANIIRDEGFEVIEAANAHEAIALLQTNTPVDIVMTDVKMPGTIDGVGLTLFIRANRPALKVIMTSTNLSASPAGWRLPSFGEDARSRIRRHGEC